MTSKYPSYPVPSAATLVCHQGSVLLLQRRFPPGVGKWSFPGGKIELGETARQAAVREVWEECRVRIEITRLLEAMDVIIYDQQQKLQYHYLILIYQGAYLAGTPVNSPESFQVRWVPLEEALNYDLTSTARQVLLALQQ